jgi:hypothetical protein
MESDDSETSTESGYETPEEHRELAAQVEMLAHASNLLLHRLDTIERALDQNTFELDTLKVRVKDGPHAAATRSLLAALNLAEPLLIGQFLRTLNRYLIHNDLVDLNDLEIHTTPLLKEAFVLQPTSTKIPYAKLLLSLPHMFV